MSLQKDRITIYDVARKAGVSVATVSRVLNGKTNVKEETRQKVQDAIEEYNFHPNIIARTLHNRQSKTIGVILPSFRNSFFVKICNEAEFFANQAGYTLLYGITSNNLDNESKLIHMLEKRQVDGFILLGGRINDVAPNDYLKEELFQISERLPLVLINSRISHKNCYTVRTDERKEFKKIVEYVIQNNHKNIALITGERGIWPTEEKVDVFRQVLQEQNITINEKLIQSGEYTVESGILSMKKLLGLNQSVTAVLCTNDILAIGAIKEAYNQNVKVPGDISVTGFDNIDMAEHFIPGLTTIGQNYKKLAESSIKRIISYINTENVPVDTVVDGKLIIRESCTFIQ